MKNYICAIVLTLLFYTSNAQTSLRGMYIDHFSTILGNNIKEDSLLNYAQDSSFNYLLLYDLHNLNLSSTSIANKLGSFIKRAREQFGVQYVGAVGETYNSIQSDIAPYNNGRTDDHERFNVFNLEFEFWTASSVNSGGYYCTRYLQAANCSCDTSGAFKFFLEQIHKIDSLAGVQQAISETYLGWFNQGQAQQIQVNVDRILLHAYRTNTSSLFSYSKTRLGYLAANHNVVNVAPIFSAEPNFMGPWLGTHSQVDAYTQYKNDFDNDNSSWKQYINILGHHWFTWRYMPRPVPSSFSPLIAASGPLTFCDGGSVDLTATQGDSYNWSNGATTRTIIVSGTGSYTCEVTVNGNTTTTPAINVAVNNNPSISIVEGNILPAQIQLNTNATPGSGHIVGYQWKRDNNDIPGAIFSSFVSVISGNYTTEVSNSNGCHTESASQPISIVNGSCNPSVPTGLYSVGISQHTQELRWNAGQLGDSITIRYTSDTSSNNYTYVRMLNIGQSSLILYNLASNAIYGWTIRMGCGGTSGAYSNASYFMTGVSTNIEPIAAGPNNEISLSVYPNPASDWITVDCNSTVTGNAVITLMDLSSKIIFSEKVNLAEGKNIFPISVFENSSGVYFLSLTTEETRKVTRIIIEK